MTYGIGTCECHAHRKGDRVELMALFRHPAGIERLTQGWNESRGLHPIKTRDRQENVTPGAIRKRHAEALFAKQPQLCDSHSQLLT